MKLTEIVQNIKSYLYNNRIPNSNRLDDRQIIYWINTQRSLWLRREYNQMREIKNNERQVLYNVEMQAIGDENSPINLQSTMSISRSVYKIPRTIHNYLNEGIVAIRGLNKLSERINLCSREEAIYKGNGWFNKGRLFAFQDEDYIWIKYGNKNDKVNLLTNIQVEGVFENPLDVDIFNGTPNEIRLGRTEYPISSAFVTFMESEILKINIQRFISDAETNDEEQEPRRTSS